jgi:hypothetical protein
MNKARRADINVDLYDEDVINPEGVALASPLI